MIRNVDRHRAEETKEGYNWSMWQAEQLKALEKYKRENQKRYSKQFKSINGQIGELLYQARQTGNMQQEIQILKAIQRGYRFPNMPKKLFGLLEEMDGKTFRQKASLLVKRWKGKEAAQATAEFFKLNDRKLEALIKATTHDMERAETAVLRMANDQYRKAIFNAQVYANSGAGTYEKAVDMATKDMLSRGLTCVEYANGARHTLADYADMAIRTASKRAYLQGEGEKRQEWGITTVIMAKRGNPCPKCLPFVDKVLIDDVWSGGKKSDGPYPLMSKAIAAGLYHPRCKDSHTTYFPGISTADDTWTKEELENIGQANKQEAERQYAARQAEKYGRLSDYSLDKDNQRQYKSKADEWKTKQKQ
nr:MAG TPA: minor capsid protein [Caudoviricetes sp.]